MKQIAVISGKGGTGKTTLTASFAALAAGDVVVADCDVDAATLHLLLNPIIEEKQVFKGSKTAVIEREKCSKCQKCVEACRFSTIKEFEVDPVLCEGCGVCVYICPEKAVKFEERITGYAFMSRTRYGPMSHAKMNPAEENSGKLVTLVRSNAKQMAEKEGKSLILIDGPPGIGCPVIASVTGVNLAVIVTEPTISGIHDLERVLDITSHFGVTTIVCVNMYDINHRNTEKIAKLCKDRLINLVGKIPFDSVATQAMVSATPVVEYAPNSLISYEIKQIWEKILII